MSLIKSHFLSIYSAIFNKIRAYHLYGYVAEERESSSYFLSQTLAVNTSRIVVELVVLITAFI